MISYYMPTKILFGDHVINENKDVLKNLGEKALIITGRSSAKKNGSLNDVTNILKELEMDYVIFDEVEENPSLETIEKGSSYGKDHNVDFLIGIGGGSPIDAAKAMGILINNPDQEPNALFTNPGLKSIPLIAIPTTCGTGTEVTPYSIITVNEEETKKNYAQSVFPEIAFIDVRYFETMPDSVIINTTIDALSHLIEGYLTVKANIFSDFIAEYGLKVWGECKKNIIEKKFAKEIREKLIIASTLAGMVIAQSGTSLPHGMGYPLTYYHNIAHGKANGILLKSFLDLHQDKTKVNKIIDLLNFNTLEDFGEYLTDLLGEVSLTKEEVEDYTKSFLSNKRKLSNHPGEVTKEDILKMYNNSTK